MTTQLISQFANIALTNIPKEYPNKISHAFSHKDDLKEPHLMYPIFYGSYDWHSSVHSHWLLVKILHSFRAHVQQEPIVALLNTQFTHDKAKGELEYLTHPDHKGFERPYGWAWFLKLSLELQQLSQTFPQAQQWEKALSPISNFFVDAFKEFLPKADYPIRVGTHFNSAFALFFAFEYAQHTNDNALLTLITNKAKQWFLHDKNIQALEPCGDEFLSPVLMEALLMSKVLNYDEFSVFFHHFLPNLANKQPQTLFETARVSDRNDGKIAHLDGLNLSRAWCLRNLAKHCKQPLQSLLQENANQHFNDAIQHIQDDFMGSHWLGSFAMLALDTQ